jgi:hypothetical protein
VSHGRRSRSSRALSLSERKNDKGRGCRFAREKVGHRVEA